MDSPPPNIAPDRSGGTVAPRTRAQRIRRAAKRLLAIGLVAYALVVLMLIVFQTLITFPGSHISPADARYVTPAGGTPLALHTRSGIPIAALFLPAFEENGTPSVRPAGHPTIVYFYGNGQVMAHSFYELDLFRRCGANVVVGDYPGFGLSGGGKGFPCEAGCYEEADALYDYAISSPDVDSQRIFAVGWSLGGAMAIHVAQQHQVAGLMTLSAFTSLDDVAAHRFWFVPTSLLLKNHFRNVERIRTVACPTVIVHGADDTLVPYPLHEGLVQASAARALKHVRVEGAGHNDVYSTGYDQIADALRELLGKGKQGVPGTAETSGQHEK